MTVLHPLLEMSVLSVLCVEGRNISQNPYFFFIFFCCDAYKNMRMVRQLGCWDHCTSRCAILSHCVLPSVCTRLVSLVPFTVCKLLGAGTVLLFSVCTASSAMDSWSTTDPPRCYCRSQIPNTSLKCLHTLGNPYNLPTCITNTVPDVDPIWSFGGRRDVAVALCAKWFMAAKRLPSSHRKAAVIYAGGCWQNLCGALDAPCTI